MFVFLVFLAGPFANYKLRVNNLYNQVFGSNWSSSSFHFLKKFGFRVVKAIVAFLNKNDDTIHTFIL